MLLKKLTDKSIYYFCTAYAFLVFRKKVYAHGLFFVQGRQFVEIGEGCSINRGVVIQASQSVKIGNRVTLSMFTKIVDIGLNVQAFADGKTEHVSAPVVIEDDCWIAAGVTILAGVTIGKGSLVAAGAVVVKDVPPHSLVGGNPAKVIRQFDRHI